MAVTLFRENTSSRFWKMNLRKDFTEKEIIKNFIEKEIYIFVLLENSIW